MDELLLEAQLREEIGKNKSKALRHQGLIPAVVYSDGKESLAIKVSRSDLIKLIHQHQIENAIITLKVKDDKKKSGRPCMIKEMQHDPVKGDILHIDLHEISLTKALKVNVPVTTKGEAVGVKSDGGSLEHILWEIEVECLPTDIPKSIEVDISNLKIGDAIHIKDIQFPPKLKVLHEPDVIVLSVAEPMKEEVAAPVEGEAPAEPEVIREKKPEAEEGKEAEGKEGKEKESKEKK
ncbi:MAG: 50S ribosomal protein L25/general stress protein Ctc [Candidatus Omnitrophica bacterium]|nr:50S ribosomal protein L25/general stress protein Ctc [Candidatus Omnitrophota bacterium]MDD5775043.1 50S ribosomal protein L25/general stress protein Ctc [Candidatus Omnitrophota bacterium]